MPINIAVLSTAHTHTKGFLENLKKGADGRRPYAIWDDVTDRGQRFAKEFGATFVPDLKTLIADPQVHGFLICAENTRHLPLLEQALPVGKPVMCEKPLTTTAAEAARVRDLQARSKAPLVCGYFQPFGAEMRAIAAHIKNGTFGTITSVRFRNAHHAAYGRWFDHADLQWFTNPELAGGGAFMDMGTHAVHLLRSLIGPVTQVTAVIANRAGIYTKSDDHGMAWLRFAPCPAGPAIIGTVEASWIHQGGPSGLEIQGSAAACWHEGGRYVIGKPGSDATPVTPADNRPACVDRLIAVVQRQLPADELAADLAACIDAVGIMEAAYQANRKGGWIPVGTAAAAGR